MKRKLSPEVGERKKTKLEPPLQENDEGVCLSLVPLCFGDNNSEATTLGKFVGDGH